MPLVGENRIMTAFGLRLIKQSPLVGLHALIEASNLAGEKIDCERVGFALAPRLNACGRMGHAEEAMRLFTNATADESRVIAERLTKLNTERQGIERRFIKREFLHTGSHRERLLREAQAVARLHSPHVIRVLDLGQAEDRTPFLVMEYLEGESFAQRLQKLGPFPVALACRLMAEVCSALAEAHEIGLVHRDVKPANIILCKQGGLFDVPKVVDFGLVKDLSGAGVSLTATSNLAGTPLYMSPEAITVPSEMDARGDLYALGAVGYFMVTGTHVFPGRTAMEVCAHHLHSQPEPPSKRLGRAVAAAPDWSGGTRMGEALRCFNDDHGRRGMARGAVVVIVSDGWDTGDPAIVGEQMARLSRLAHRIVWVNPRKAAAGYQPLVGGMAAALPHVDAFVSGHSVAALDEVSA